MQNPLPEMPGSGKANLPRHRTVGVGQIHGGTLGGLILRADLDI
jgi:hypothetical protein